PENEEAPAGRQGAISDEETIEECTSPLAESIRLARVALTQVEFEEWLDNLLFPVEFVQTGSEDSMILYREYVARESGQ
ncbi:MAG: hypothetical protein WCQ16_06855, partial [Verrucomicrobiae bacterium]